MYFKAYDENGDTMFVHESQIDSIRFADNGVVGRHSEKEWGSNGSYPNHKYVTLAKFKFPGERDRLVSATKYAIQVGTKGGVADIVRCLAEMGCMNDD